MGPVSESGGIGSDGPAASTASINALPSFAGGTAAKVADDYEKTWTVSSLLDLLAGRIAGRST